MKKSRMKKAFLRHAVTGALALVVATGLSGCVGLAIGAGAAVGVAAAKEGGLRNSVSDASIELQITEAWIKHDADLFRRLDMTVKEGRVLITGIVPTPDARVDAIRLAWQADGVREVINEIAVDEGEGVAGYATDTWITGQLKSKLLLDKYIQSINYTVETVRGTVYLMGIAQDQKELERVINHARTLSRVRNVVSYVRLRGESLPAVQAPYNKANNNANNAQAAAPQQNTSWADTTSGSGEGMVTTPPPSDTTVTSEPLSPP